MALSKLQFYCQKILPLVYDDSLSYYELLCKVVNKLNEIIDAYGLYDSTLTDIINELNELKDEFEKFKESGFEDYYKEQVEEWINNNLEYIFTNVVRQVFFGLNLEGYFVAYVPDTWDDIYFDTGAVYTLDTYGRLILRYDVDSPETVDQTPEERN